MFLKSFVFLETYFAPKCAILNPMKGEDVLQSYFHDGDGFCPLLIRPGWQVSHLNDRTDLHADTLRQVEKHDATDEVFILVKGDAALVIGIERANAFALKIVPMKTGVTYNIPCGVWHTIVTSPGMQVMIVEKDNTHVADVMYRALTDGEREALRAKLETENL